MATDRLSVQPDKADMTPSDDHQGENILLVDDLPGNLMVYQTVLEELGQNLVTARSGEEALKLVLKNDFAVILLDVNMPTMNGFETAALIRKRKKSARTPIIFLTAFTDDIGMAQSYANGAVDYLPTPIIPEVLKTKVRVFIELSQMRRQAALQAEERARREAAEESAQKSAFLAKVSESLGRSQGQVDGLHTLARLPVPDLADVAIAWLQDNEDGPARLECSLTDVKNDAGQPAFALTDFPWLQKMASKVVATGQPLLVDKVPSPPDTNILQIFGSLLVLPLIIQGTPLGGLVLARKRSGAVYGPHDLPFANDLAGRAAVAFENIMLMERIRENDRRKDEFLGMLAHELRNPLAPIFNAVQLQKLLDPADPRMTDLREIIDRQAKHMGRLIDDLLDATRLAHGKILLRKERTDLCKIIHQTIKDYRPIIEASGLSLKVSGPEAPIWIEGDPTRLVQAVGNLLHNAHKFTKPGGAIGVTVGVDKNRRAASITVSDNGIGIEPRMLSCVFDVFRQADQGLDRSRGGLGLGLALVKGLVELHNGTVGATSGGTDKGSTFSIKLPIEQAHANDAPAIPGAWPAIDKKYRILLIEDNRDAAESAQMLLSLEDHEVRTAHTATSGLEVARTFHPQIILCDIGLPEIDGYQLVRTLRREANLASTYIVALTGYGREQDRLQALEAGFDLHLTKPIDFNSFRRVVMLANESIKVAAS